MDLRTQVESIVEEIMVAVQRLAAQLEGPAATRPDPRELERQCRDLGLAVGHELFVRLLPEVPWVTSPGPRRAHLEGFDLYVSLPVPAEDRVRLEQLCRYLLRPPVAQDRLRLTNDGRVLVALKSPWADGTSHLLFEPLELLEKLAALIPKVPSHYTT